MTLPHLLLPLLSALLLAACAGLQPPADGPGSLPPEWMQVAPPEAPLAQWAAHSAVPAGRSGCQPLVSGGAALATRLALIRQARVSLDVQTYLVGDDSSGRQLLRALRDAAARGVRVRLLVDDFHTLGQTDLLLGLAAQPGVSVRLYNPFTHGRDALLGRLWGLATDFQRLNRRMHNKLLVADGLWTLVGGRNLADEYFMRGEEAGFVDFELLCAGAVLPALGQHVDSFWNSRLALPVQALADSPLGPAQRLAAFERLTQDAATAAPPRLPPSGAPGPAAEPLDDLQQGRITLTPVDAFLPARPAPDAPSADPALLPVAALLAHARQRVLLVSPYFLPSAQGLQRLRQARERGVEVQVLTGAPAESDEPLAALAYAGHRVALLQAGVRLFELSSEGLKRDPRVRLVLGSRIGRLHAKLAFIDGQSMVVGSMNLDPRSAFTNTELVMVVHGPELVQRSLEAFALPREQGVHELLLAPDGQQLRWRDPAGALRDDAPDALQAPPWWQRAGLQLLLWLVPEAWL